MRKESHISCDNLQKNKEEDPAHVNFIIPEDDDALAMQFSNLLLEEMSLRQMTLDDDATLEDMREELRDVLSVEQWIFRARQVVERHDNALASMLYLIEQALICILHMENCCSKKLVRMLLVFGQKHAPSLDEYAASTQVYVR